MSKVVQKAKKVENYTYLINVFDFANYFQDINHKFGDLCKSSASVDNVTLCIQAFNDYVVLHFMLLKIYIFYLFICKLALRFLNCVTATTFCQRLH